MINFQNLSQINEKPPTVYDILNSIVNFDSEEQIKIKDLALAGHTTIFNFDYPLSSKLDKEKFEVLILKHFLMRRIGFETVTAFRIHLDAKLNEVMPYYNKMFDAIDGWNLFNDGETIQKIGADNRIVNNTVNIETSNSLENRSSTENEETSDRRHSDTPQDELQNVRDGKYVNKYDFDNNISTSSDESNSIGSSESNTTNNTNDSNNYNETIHRTAVDKISLYKEFQENIKSIYTLIFQELECLFYQLD